MESDIPNLGDPRVTPEFASEEADRLKSELAAGEKRGAGGLTIYVPTGICEFATVGISTVASATGTVRIHGEGSARFVQSFSSTLVVLTDAQDNRSSNDVPLEGLAFQGAFQPVA